MWVLPAATFIVGLVIGFAVWGTSGDDDDEGALSDTTPSLTASPGDGEDIGQTVTVAVPQACLDAIDESEQSLDLLEQAATAISDLDAARLQEIVDELQDASEQIRSLGTECRDLTEVTLGSPSATPTS
ncbi:hypothetical protein BH20ACT5_BH20ACT5_16580 [soil metagenome]